MKILAKSILIVLPAALLGFGATYLLFPEQGVNLNDSQKELQRTIPDAKSPSSPLAVAVKTGGRIGERKPMSPVSASRVAKTEADAATNAVDEVVSEIELTRMFDQLLDELKVAADSGDYTRLRETISQLKALFKQKMANGSHIALFTSAKRKILDALMPYGAEAIPEVLDYVLDEDAGIQQSATDQLLTSLRDPSLGDRGRAEIVTASATVLTDGRTLDVLLSEVYNMRHSVAAATMEAILEEGTPEAIERITKTMGFYTGDSSITTIEGLNAWVEQNPDGSFDGLLYGPMPTTVIQTSK